jgi:ATP-dependent DNA ligase
LGFFPWVRRGKTAIYRERGSQRQSYTSLLIATREAILKRLLRGRYDQFVMDGLAGNSTRLFQLVCELELEGIVAKPLADPYEARWFKVLNHPSYSQQERRAEP